MSKSHHKSKPSEGPFRFAKGPVEGKYILRFRTSEGVCGSIVQAADGKPSREVRPGVGIRPTQKIASPKSIGIGEAESGLEADAFKMFHFDRGVVSYTTQPFTVVYEVGDKAVSTYPDVELRLIGGRFEIVQIKTFSTFEKHLRENPRFRGEREVFEQLGWSYRVLTEREIRIEPQYSNRKLLWHYRNRRVEAPMVASIRATIKRYPNVTVRKIVEAFRADAVHEVDIYALVARHVLDTDMEAKLGLESRLIVSA